MSIEEKESNYKLRNYTEFVVKDQLNKLLSKYDICKCGKCILDMTAYALNKLPPEYIVTDIGDLYKRIDKFTPQAEIDIQVVINEAIKVVSQNPKHNL